MRALVTGADGFLGANLCNELLAQGHDVIGATLNRKGHTSLDALGVTVRLEYGNILDVEYLRRIVNAHEIEWVFQLAGVSIVRVAAQDPYRAIMTNVAGTLNVLEACECGPVQSVVVASSDKAYGDYGGVRYTEELPLNPSGAYELSKALADTLARGWARLTAMRVVVTRCANLYGPGDLHWSRLVPNSCRRIVRGKPPEVHPGAWTYQREWLHVDDAVRAYVMLAEKGTTGEAYNVGSGETETAGNVARELAAMGGIVDVIESEWEIDEIPAQELCCDKMAALSWGPKRELWEGMRETLLWYGDYVSEPSDRWAWEKPCVF